MPSLSARHTVTSLTATALALLLSACGASQLSAEVHARQYANTAADNQFSPNFVINRADTARSMVKFLDQFHALGAKDRAARLPESQAIKRAGLMRDRQFLDSLHSRETFAGKTYDTSTPPPDKIRDALGKAIAETYLDGYKGKP